jgi:hypothetical protein
MKELPKKDQKEISGGGYREGTCIPPESQPGGPEVNIPDEAVSGTQT